MKNISIFTTVSLFLLTGQAFCQSINVKNSTDHPIYVWSQPELTKKWQKDLYVSKNATESLPIPLPGKYWLAITDEGRRTVHKGWMDLHAELQKNPNALLVINSVFFTECIEQEIWEARNGRWLRSIRRTPVSRKVYHLNIEHSR